MCCTSLKWWNAQFVWGVVHGRNLFLGITWASQAGSAYTEIQSLEIFWLHWAEGWAGVKASEKGGTKSVGQQSAPFQVILWKQWCPAFPGLGLQSYALCQIMDRKRLTIHLSKEVCRAPGLPEALQSQLGSNRVVSRLFEPPFESPLVWVTFKTWF